MIEPEGCINDAIKALRALLQDSSPEIRLRAASELLQFGYSIMHDSGHKDGDEWKEGGPNDGE